VRSVSVDRSSRRHRDGVFDRVDSNALCRIEALSRAGRISHEITCGGRRPHVSGGTRLGVSAQRAAPTRDIAKRRLRPVQHRPRAASRVLAAGRRRGDEAHQSHSDRRASNVNIPPRFVHCWAPVQGRAFRGAGLASPPLFSAAPSRASVGERYRSAMVPPSIGRTHPGRASACRDSRCCAGNFGR